MPEDRDANLEDLLHSPPARDEIEPPVISRPQVLPFNALSWENFERLCTRLVASEGDVVDCHRYGRRGDDQAGIDILAHRRTVQGVLERWGYQCKRWHAVTSGDLRRIVDDFTYPADRYVVMISTEASTDLRDAVADRPEVDLWDAEDLSSRLKDRPDLVEDFFHPAWRAAFCTVPFPTPLLPLTPDLSKAPSLVPEFVGRTNQLTTLTDFWKKEDKRVLTVVGFGGMGKSTLVRQWLDSAALNADAVFWWSFYQGRNVDEFLEAALIYLTGGTFDSRSTASTWGRVQRLGTNLSAGRFLIVLDGLEVMQEQNQHKLEYGQVKDPELRGLLKTLANAVAHSSKCVITTRVPPIDIAVYPAHQSMDLQELSESDSIELMTGHGVHGDDADLQGIAENYGGHPLTLSLLTSYLGRYANGHASRISEIPQPLLDENRYQRVHKLLGWYNERLSVAERSFLKVFSTFRRPVKGNDLRAFFRAGGTTMRSPGLASLSEWDFQDLVDGLVKARLVRYVDTEAHYLNLVHPVVQSYFYDQLKAEPDSKQDVNWQLAEYVWKSEVVDTPSEAADLSPVFDVIHYLCEAGRYDIAANVYADRVSEGWGLSVRQGLYATALASLRELFSDADFAQQPLVRKDYWARLLDHVGLLLMTLGRPSEAESLYRRAAQASKQNEKTTVYYNLTEVLVQQGRPAEAIAAAEEAVRCAQIGRSRAWEYRSLAYLGWSQFICGKTVEATQSFEQAEDLCRETWSQYAFLPGADGLRHITYLIARGLLSSAQKIADWNVDFLQESKVLLVDLLVGFQRLLADIKRAAGGLKEAEKVYTDVLELARGSGLREEIVLTLLGRGRLLTTLGRYNQARADLERGLSICQDCGYRLHEADIRTARAELARAGGILDAARTEAEHALSLARDTGYAWSEGDTLHLLGEVLAAQNRQEEAREVLSSALEIRQHLQDPKAERTNRLLLSLVR